jgi:rubrerythrin
MIKSVDDLVKALDEEALARHCRYLELSNQADRSGFAEPAKFFRALAAIETARQGLYRRRLSSLSDPSKTNEYHVCPGCGYAYGAEPASCPVCETAGVDFEMIS